MESRGDRARRSEGNGSKRLSIEAKVRLGNLILD
jgi:hypothetical protein